MEKTEKKAWLLNEEAVQAVLQDISFGNQIRPTAKKYGKTTFCSSIKSAALLPVSLNNWRFDKNKKVMGDTCTLKVLNIW